MPDPDIKAFSLFEIGKDQDDSPLYVFRLDRAVQAGTPATQVVDAAKALLTSQEAADARRTGSHRPTRNPGRPERDLDMNEAMTTGTHLYAFCLNVEEAGQQRLLFAEQGPPFLIFPMNSSTGENFIAIQSHGADQRFASFTCKIDDVRSSALAGRIRASLHPDVLRIPFYFNVRDPVIGAAPWVHSDHSQGAPPHPHPHIPPFTHGGVHPSPSVFFSVGLAAT